MTSRIAVALGRATRTRAFSLKSLVRPCPSTGHRHLSSRTIENSETYTSPLQDLFDQMEQNLTSLGTSEPLQIPSRTLDCGIPESALRFTTTSYGRTMNAPFVQPKEHAVAMKVNLEHLPLNELEFEILREICGRRVSGHELRMQSNQFASRMENKRHLVSQLDRVMASCKKLAHEITEARQTESTA